MTLFQFTQDGILIISASLILVLSMFFAFSGLVSKKKPRVYIGLVVFLISFGLIVKMLNKDADLRRAEAAAKDKAQQVEGARAAEEQLEMPLWREITPYNNFGNLQAIVVDPAGSSSLGNIDFESNALTFDAETLQVPRLANRAFIPQTATVSGSAQEITILGPALEQGKTHKVRLIGAVNEILIAVPLSKSFQNIRTLADYQKAQPKLPLGLLIGDLETDITTSNRGEATDLLGKAIQQFQSK